MVSIFIDFLAFNREISLPEVAYLGMKYDTSDKIQNGGREPLKTSFHNISATDWAVPVFQPNFA